MAAEVLYHLSHSLACSKWEYPAMRLSCFLGPGDPDGVVDSCSCCTCFEKGCFFMKCIVIVRALHEKRFNGLDNVDFLFRLASDIQESVVCLFVFERCQVAHTYKHGSPSLRFAFHISPPQPA